MLNILHRSLGALILLFMALHLSNHLVGIWGVEAHINFMDFARLFYRNVYVEVLLLAGLISQAALGLYFVYRSWGKRFGFFERAQAISGCYLVFFLIAHVSATFNARIVLDLDTNFYFATAGLHLVNLGYFFVPYYFMAILAVFVHISSAIHYWVLSINISKSKANRVGVLVIAIGTTVASLIVLSLSGVFYDISIPREYGVMFGL